jgi:hypothetical protein
VVLKKRKKETHPGAARRSWDLQKFEQHLKSGCKCISGRVNPSASRECEDFNLKDRNA